MSDFVVYGTPLSPFVRKVQAVLHHADAEYDFENINIMDMPDWFKEISPARRIPVLRDRTLGKEGIPGTIADSSAICLFLERRLDAGLYGQSAYDAGRIAWFEEYADTNLAQLTGTGIFRPLFFPRIGGGEPDIATARETWRDKLPPLFDYLEQTLDGGRHFVGGSFSLADIAVACQLIQLDLVAGLPDAARWPALVRHTEAMKADPIFAANLARCEKTLGRVMPEGKTALD